MKLALVFFLALPVYGGSKTQDEMKAYVARFIGAAKAHSQIVFLSGPLANFAIDRLILEGGVTDGSHILGECYVKAGQTPRIVVNFLVWESLQDDMKEEIMFHELGHCILGRPHVEQMIAVEGGEIPKSLMYPYSLPNRIYAPHREYYLDELFGIISK